MWKPARALRATSLALAAMVLVTLNPLPPQAAAAAQTVEPEAPQQLDSVPGHPVPVEPPPADSAKDWSDQQLQLALPEAGAVELTVGAALAAQQDPTPALAGSLPVAVAPVTSERLDTTAGPTRVRVSVLEQTAAADLGVAGVLLQVAPADRWSPAGPVELSLDYSGFRHAYGGDWGSRLQLVRFPACAAHRPKQAECRVAEPVPSSRNDRQAARVTAEVQVGLDRDQVGGWLYALTAEPGGDTGDYTATSLSPAGSWDVSAQTGAFTWSYPMRVPPVPGELTPELTATYNAAAADGRIATSNNQTSWLGEGWELSTGFVERRYQVCVEDTDGGSPETGDLCWDGNHMVLSLNGSTTELIRDEDSGAWRLRNDDGSRVEHRFGSQGTVNGDDNGEYWVVTTTDGTQYHFGLNRLPGWSSGDPVTHSAWTVPVFGNDPGEPCHSSSFATSHCLQAYRWNLDYVVDPRGNTITYTYAPETNRYGRNLAKDVSTYVRGGTLVRIEYGTRKGTELSGNAPARVVFDTADRCLTDDCGARNGANWPDVPWDQHCDADTCPDRFSPTFWSTKRLVSVTTQVWDGDSYRNVDRWTFTHSFPAPTGNNTPALWLRSIQHTGLVGGELAQPPVTFDSVGLPNRVNSVHDGLSAMSKRRISAIHTESGATIGVHYASAQCTADDLPTPDANHQRCFPVRWAPKDAEPIDDWFHKYVVESVSQVDRVGGGPTQFTHYDYEGGAAWAYRDDPLVPEEYRSWSEWRGYETVQVRIGEPNDPGNPQQSVTRYRYFRGMDGDRRANGGKKSVTVTDSTGASYDDSPQLAGFLLEEITYDGVDGDGQTGAEVTGTVHQPWTHGPTATDGDRKAYQVQVGSSTTRTTLADGGHRRTQVSFDYDQYGQLIEVEDMGDVDDPADDQCTRTTYARNTDTWLLALPSQVETVAVNCAATPTYPQDIVSGERTAYDGGDVGDAPTAGNPTRVEQLTSYDEDGAEYTVVRQASYDAYGRVVAQTDALERTTSTEYEPATGLPTTVIQTNPLGHESTTTVEPAWNEPTATVDPNGRRTDLQRDPLGRLTAVWATDRSKADGHSPTARFEYGVRDDGASWVSQQRLGPNGNYLTSYTLYDGFLRQRQVQRPSPQGGRIIVEKYYDARGLVAKENQAYYNEDPPSTTLFAPDDNQVPAQTVYAYDGAGRVTAEIYEELNVEKWRTTIVHGGDHTTVIPPEGGIPATTYTDARERVTELRQYYEGDVAGPYHRTTRTYTPSGKLATLTDPLGNVWSHRYDLAGNLIEVVDPDRGTRIMTYDAAGQLRTVTDARGQTVVHQYDLLGRRTRSHADELTGPLLATWTYDTLAKGQLTSTTRYTDGNAYITRVTGYDAGYRATGRETVIPSIEEELAGTYQTSIDYHPDGSIKSVTLPQLGDLPEETVFYFYDDWGQPTETIGDQMYVTGSTYSALGELTQLQLGQPGDRVWQTLHYEAGTRRLSESVVQRELPGASYLEEVEYRYDPAGNVLEIDTLVEEQVRDRQCFDYDGLRRLTEAWSTTGSCADDPGSAVGGPAPYWTSYTYDEVGRRLSELQHGVDGGVDLLTSLSYPEGGQDQPHAPESVIVTGPVGTVSTGGVYHYDAAGNTTQRPALDGTQQYDWDVTGQLVSATAGGVTTEFVNTPDNQRLLARQPEEITLYLASGQVRLDRDTGAVTGTRYYLHGQQPVAARSGGKVSYLLSDYQGTATLAVDAGTLQATSRWYDPFGRPRTEPSQWPGGQGFVGGVDSGDTGLVRLGVRDYDPATGMFVSVDPVFTDEIPQQLNAYTYAVNNPTTFSDSTGEFFLWDIIGAAIHAVGKLINNRTVSIVGRTISSIGRAYNAYANRVTRPSCNFAGDCRIGARGPSDEELRQQEERRRKLLVNFAVSEYLGKDALGELGDNLALSMLPSWPPEGSISFCSAYGGALLISVGYENCVNVDVKGITTSGAWKFGLEAGVGGDASVLVRYNNVSADAVGNGKYESVEAGVDVKALTGVSVNGNVSRDHATGDFSYSVDASWGLGAKVSFGGIHENHGENSGYIHKW